MQTLFSRRLFLAASVSLMMIVVPGLESHAADKIKLRLSASSSETDQRAVAILEKFAPAVASFADFEPHWNSSLFKQGTELEAIARGNLEMSIASAQELAVFIPEFSIFTAGYVHRDAAHQVAVFNAPLMTQFKRKAEELLDIKLLSVMYLGRRQLNLRTEQNIQTPEDLSGVNLRMPGTDAWQFLGRALGANPTPMAFTEVYTGLQTGAIDGQDNPLPTTVDKKFYEVTKQIILTSHLVDLNYIAMSKSVWNGLSESQQKIVQKAADEAAEYGRRNQLAQEESLVDFIKQQGLKVYSPNVDAFRKRVQDAYLNSDYAKTWPDGVLAEINAL